MNPSGPLFVLLPAATYSPTRFPMQWLCFEIVLHGKCVDEGRAPSYKTKGPEVMNPSGPFVSYYCRQRPTLPHSFPCSTIGGIRLNFRVRNGNGCDPDPMTTGILDG